MIRLGICTSIDHAPILREIGYDYLELNMTQVAQMSEAAYADLHAAVQSSPLPVEAMNSMIPAEYPLCGPEGTGERVRAYLQTAFSRAQALGVQVVVFGSGGASVTVCHVLKSLGADPVVVISRTGENNYENLDRHLDAKLLINATPLGMYPNNGESPVDLTRFSALDGVLDVIYNPARTALMLQAEQLGIPHASGLSMLVAQAKKACEYFTGNPVPDAEIDRIERLLSRQMENIILIGMPGCGKSTVGRAVAERLGWAYVDTDHLIESTYGARLQDVTDALDKERFLDVEARVIQSLRMQRAVLATGGSVVYRPEAMRYLTSLGPVVFLDVPLPLILERISRKPDRGLAIAPGQTVEDLFREREALYRQWATCRVAAGDIDVSETANAVFDAIAGCGQAL